MDPEIKKLLEEIEIQLNAGQIDLNRWKTLRQGLQKRLVKPTFPKVGDKIYAKYFHQQYFPARVDYLDREKQEFHITWDDNGPDGRVVKVTDVALDRVPGVGEIGVESNVLFEQGAYRGNDKWSGGMRWHLGRITNISRTPEGRLLYNGEHVYGEQDGKWITYRGFEQTFSHLTLEQLRVSPNALESFEGADADLSCNSRLTRYLDLDVFVCYSSRNTTGKEINPMRIIADVEEKLGVKTNLKFRNPSLEDIAIMIQKCKLVLAFISNEFAQDESCQQQFQFAKKTSVVPVIPIVVGNGFDWTKSVIGLLIAGELYIHFKDESVYSKKLQELEGSMRKSLNPQISQSQSLTAQAVKKEKCPIFVSYCWTNSYLSYEAKEVRKSSGTSYSDPRKVKKDVERHLRGQKLWLDIEQLGTSNQSDRNSSMFEQIAEGLAGAQVILTFISSEYSKSENCNMEFNHAVKTMKIPTVPIIVGDKGSLDWVQRQVGMVLGQLEAQDKRSERIDMRQTDNTYDYEQKVGEICDRIRKYVGDVKDKANVTERKEEKETKSSRAPKIGDHVIAHWIGGQFFFSTIVSYDKASMCFTVDWDDGGTTHRVVKYSEIAKDDVIGEGDVAIGTTVLFPQGQYRLNAEDDFYSGFRYFEGEVTSMRMEGGKMLYSGHHTRYKRGETPRFRGVSYEFTDYPVGILRLAPNAFEVLNIN